MLRLHAPGHTYKAHGQGHFGKSPREIHKQHQAGSSICRSSARRAALTRSEARGRSRVTGLSGIKNTLMDSALGLASCATSVLHPRGVKATSIIEMLRHKARWVGSSITARLQTANPAHLRPSYRPFRSTHFQIEIFLFHDANVPVAPPPRPLIPDKIDVLRKERTQASMLLCALLESRKVEPQETQVESGKCWLRAVAVLQI